MIQENEKNKDSPVRAFKKREGIKSFFEKDFLKEEKEETNEK